MDKKLMMAWLQGQAQKPELSTMRMQQKRLGFDLNEAVLSPAEEKYAKAHKSMLRNMVEQYGKEKGTRVFYATVRENVKKLQENANPPKDPLLSPPLPGAWRGDQPDQPVHDEHGDVRYLRPGDTRRQQYIKKRTQAQRAERDKNHDDAFYLLDLMHGKPEAMKKEQEFNDAEAAAGREYDEAMKSQQQAPPPVIKP